PCLNGSRLVFALALWTLALGHWSPLALAGARNPLARSSVFIGGAQQERQEPHTPLFLDNRFAAGVRKRIANSSRRWRLQQATQRSTSRPLDVLVIRLADARELRRHALEEAGALVDGQGGGGGHHGLELAVAELDHAVSSSHGRGPGGRGTARAYLAARLELGHRRNLVPKLVIACEARMCIRARILKRRSVTGMPRSARATVSATIA